jgi:hypothetical protein
MNMKILLLCAALSMLVVAAIPTAYLGYSSLKSADSLPRVPEGFEVKFFAKDPRARRPPSAL